MFIGLQLSTVPAAAEPATVRHVLDGDSFILADGRQARLIGINAPEFGKDGAPDQPLARAARARLVALVEKKQVTLVFEKERQDHYGRLLARARLADGDDAGTRLLREGLGWAIAIPPNLENLDADLAAEDEARGARRGVWNEPAYAPKPADGLAPGGTGFQRVEGRIRRHGQGRSLIYFDLSPNLTLTVPRADWKKYFSGEPSAWVGQRVIARGWVTEHRGRLRLRVAHPAMLKWSD